MNSTFKCWLIANFEIVFFWLTTILGVLFFLVFSDKNFENFENKNSYDFMKVVLMYGIFVFVFNTPTKNGAFQYGKYIVLLGLAIIFIFYSEAPESQFNIEDKETFNRFFLWPFGALFVTASGISGWLSYYTYKNIYEVLSRRMLYRNSNVSLFEYTWKYTLDRFCNITVSIVTCIPWLALLIFCSILASEN